MTRSFLSVPLLFEHPDPLFSSPTGGPLKEKHTSKGEVAELSTAFTAALHRPATRLPASNRTTTKTSFCNRGDGRDSVLATGTNRGEPPLGGGRAIRRLVHDPILARHKFPSRASGSFIRSRGAWT